MARILFDIKRFTADPAPRANMNRIAYADSDPVAVTFVGEWFADLIDDTGAPTGISLHCTKAPNGGLSTSVSAGTYQTYEDAFWNNPLRSNVNDNYTFEFRGLASKSYTVKVAGISDSASRNSKYTIDGTAYDTSNQTNPSLSTIVTHSGSGIDTLTIDVTRSDTVGQFYGFLSFIDLEVTDAPSGISGTITESFTLSDSVSSSLIYNVSASESITLSDEITVSAQFAGSIAESISIADQVSASSGIISGSTAESLSISDSVSSKVIYSASISESLSLSDQIGSQLIAKASMAELISLVDSVADSSPTAYNVSISESLSFVDSIREGEATGTIFIKFRVNPALKIKGEIISAINAKAALYPSINIKGRVQ